MSVAFSVPATRYVGVFLSEPAPERLILRVFRPTPRSKSYIVTAGSAAEAPEVCLATFVAWTSSGGVRSGQENDYWPPSASHHYTWATSARGDVVGIHGYRLENGLLRSQKTWVHRRHRRKGLMNELWSFSLAKWQPTSVSVYCISKVSYAAMKKIARKHPTIDWEVER